jgi:hypothetical protein
VIPDPRTRRSELLEVSSLINNGGDAPSLVHTRLPWLVGQIRADAGAGRFDEWGLSTVIEGGVAPPVIPPPLFDELHRLAGLTEQWPVGNAGVLHVYGYLLSAVRTSAGPKRSRWLNPSLARGLGLDDDALTPWAAEPTVLARVAAIARPIMDSPGDAAGVQLWIDETNETNATNATDATADASTVARTVVVRTHPSTDAVLFYAVDEGEGMRLITVFPVARFDDAWIADRLSSPPRLRYNAVARALPARSALSTQRVLIGA